MGQREPGTSGMPAMSMLSSFLFHTRGSTSVWSANSCCPLHTSIIYFCWSEIFLLLFLRVSNAFLCMYVYLIHTYTARRRQLSSISFNFRGIAMKIARQDESRSYFTLYSAPPFLGLPARIGEKERSFQINWTFSFCPLFGGILKGSLTLLENI